MSEEYLRRYQETTLDLKGVEIWCSNLQRHTPQQRIKLPKYTVPTDRNQQKNNKCYVLQEKIFRNLEENRRYTVTVCEKNIEHHYTKIVVFRTSVISNDRLLIFFERE